MIKFQGAPSDETLRKNLYMLFIYAEGATLYYGLSREDHLIEKDNLEKMLPSDLVFDLKKMLLSNGEGGEAVDDFIKKKGQYISEIVEKNSSNSKINCHLKYKWISSATFNELPEAEKKNWIVDKESGHYLQEFSIRFKDLFATKSNKFINLKMLKENIPEGYKAYCEYREKLGKERETCKAYGIDCPEDKLTKNLIQKSFNHHDLTPNFYTYNELIDRWNKLGQPKSSIEDAVLNKNALIPYYRPNSNTLLNSSTLEIYDQSKDTIPWDLAEVSPENQLNIREIKFHQRFNYKKRYEGYEVLKYETVREIFQNKKYEAYISQGIKKSIINETYFEQTEFERYTNYLKWVQLKEIGISELHFLAKEIEAYEKKYITPWYKRVFKFKSLGFFTKSYFLRDD